MSNPQDQYSTEYSRKKNINTLDKGSYNDWGDGTPARQVLTKSGLFGSNVNENARYVEAVYTDNAQTVTYSYFDTSAKTTAYEVVVVKYSVPQDTEFTSAEWL